MSFGKWRHCRRPRRSDLSHRERRERRKVTGFFFLINSGVLLSEWESGCGASRTSRFWKQGRHTSRQAIPKAHKHIFRSLLYDPQNIKLCDRGHLLMSSWLTNVLRSNQTRCLKMPQNCEVYLLILATTLIETTSKPFQLLLNVSLLYSVSLPMFIIAMWLGATLFCR